MIPKVIHYIWVGKSSLGPTQKRCIESWHRILPGWQIKLWNEENLPKEVMNHPYVKTMYGKGKWAFVSDYVRFWALKNEGGVYLDTDTEVIKDLGPLLEHQAFFGKTKDGMIAAGVIGSMPGHPCVKDILSVYDKDTDFSLERTSPRTVTKVLNENSYSDVTVYNYKFFNPCNDGERCTPDKLALAYTNNHWAESWVPFAGLRKLLRRLGIMPLIKYVTKT